MTVMAASTLNLFRPASAETHTSIPFLLLNALTSNHLTTTRVCGKELRVALQLKQVRQATRMQCKSLQASMLL